MGHVAREHIGSETFVQGNLKVRVCEVPRTRYLTKPWTPRNLRRRSERCSRKQQKLKHSFTRKSSATLSVLFTQPTKQSVVFVMTCRHVGCFRFLETENCKSKTFRTKVATDATSKRHNMTKDFKVKVVTSCLHSKPKELFQKHHISSQNPRNCMLKETFPFKRFVLHQNYFQTSSNFENLTKLLKSACRPVV